MKTNYSYEELETTVLQFVDAVVEIAGEFAGFREFYAEAPARLKTALHSAVVAYLQSVANGKDPLRSYGQFTPALLYVPIPGSDSLVDMLVRLAQFQVEDHATQLACNDGSTYNFRNCEESPIEEFPNHRAIYAPPEVVACPGCGKSLEEFLDDCSVHTPMFGKVARETYPAQALAQTERQVFCDQSPTVPDAF